MIQHLLNHSVLGLWFPPQLKFQTRSPPLNTNILSAIDLPNKQKNKKVKMNLTYSMFFSPNFLRYCGNIRILLVTIIV